MGCDIHLYVERKENGTWVTCDRWKMEDDRMAVDYGERFYRGRNYSLFAILADVRNGRGFAGIKTGEGFNPIADPRGIPDDACQEYKNECESWGSDGHSHSFFTVEELMAYDWTQVSCLQGWVGIEAFEEFERWKKRNHEGPSDYCGAISGGSINHISNDDMRVRVQQVRDMNVYGKEFTAALQKSGQDCYTLLEWTTPYYKEADKFLSESLPKLWRLGSTSDVRITFFFDN